MKMQFAVLGCLVLASCLAHVRAQVPSVQTDVWVATTWRGERAYELVTSRWRAIVSLDRARLVHLGPVDPEAGNLLFEVGSRENPFSWGGHRVWLGPQSLWGWPPPDGWERAAAESASVVGGRLELRVPDVGRGFPRLTRIYELAGERLACRIAISGGERSVQVMQVVQMPPATTVDLRPGRTAQWPRGYFRVGGSEGPIMQPEFPLPNGVTETDDGVRIAYVGRSDKLAFPPQTLVANVGAHRLHLAFGEAVGPEVAAPDGGYYTQVYIGHPEAPVVEIEQLSPQWLAGSEAEFSMYIELTDAP